MANGTIEKPLNENVEALNNRLRMGLDDFTFKYQVAYGGITYEGVNVYDTILIIGNWGNYPRMYMITFNGSGNVTKICLSGNDTDATAIDASFSNGKPRFTMGEFLNGAFISVRGLTYSEVTT